MLFSAKESRMMRNNTTLFRWGSGLAIITGASHLVGHFLPIPIENTHEAELLSLMTSYQKPILGGAMSMMDIQNGLSLCYSLFFFLFGIANFHVIKRAVDYKLINDLSKVYAIGMFIGTLISLRYFFWLPVISFLTLALIFSISAIQLRKGSR
jgi:hypothetical protein